MRITHGHLQGLVTQPHLNPTNIDATADQTRRAGMTQNMRDDLIVRAKPHFHLCFIPYLAKPNLVEHREGALQLRMRNTCCFAGTASERNSPAAIRFGEPECNPLILNIVPGNADCFPETAARVDEEQRKPITIFTARLDRGEQAFFFLIFKESNTSHTLLLPDEFR